MGLKRLSNIFVLLILTFTVWTSCKIATPKNKKIHQENNKTIYFSIPMDKILDQNDLVITELLPNRDGRFEVESVDELIYFLNKQKGKIFFKINVRYNSNSSFNQDYSDALKDNLIKQINDRTDLELDKDYKVKALGASENLIVLDKDNAFAEMPNRIEIRLVK